MNGYATLYGELFACIAIKIFTRNNCKMGWAVVILLSVIGCIGYAVYCSWVGGTFAGSIKIGVPDLVHVTFNCKR